jgi:hypothetical protein
MRASSLALALTIAAVIGCDMIKQHMPAPTANKAVTVPVDAKLMAMGIPDTLVLPSDQVGTYYIAEDDTSKIVSVTSVHSGQSPLTPDLRDQLEPKRKYRVYFTPGSAAPTGASKSATPEPTNPLAAPTTSPVM